MGEPKCQHKVLSIGKGCRGQGTSLLPQPGQDQGPAVECWPQVVVSGEHHTPKLGRAALGVPTPCVTPREDLLIVLSQDMGWKEEVMEVLCDTHLPGSSAAGAAGAAGAVHRQRVPVPGVVVDTCAQL